MRDGKWLEPYEIVKELTGKYTFTYANYSELRGFGVSVQVAKSIFSNQLCVYAMVRSGVILWLVLATSTSRSATFFFKHPFQLPKSLFTLSIL